jgi:hypothetical protein
MVTFDWTQLFGVSAWQIDNFLNNAKTINFFSVIPTHSVMKLSFRLTFTCSIVEIYL